MRRLPGLIYTIVLPAVRGWCTHHDVCRPGRPRELRELPLAAASGRSGGRRHAERQGGRDVRAQASGCTRGWDPHRGGAAGGPGFLLRNGSLLVLAVSDVRVEGERLEGRGIMPDVVVPFRLPYAAGHDPQLDAAIEELAQGS
jgi:hypothetical protein